MVFGGSTALASVFAMNTFSQAPPAEGPTLRIVGTVIFVPSLIALLYSLYWVSRIPAEGPVSVIARWMALWLGSTALMLLGGWIGGIGILPHQHPDFACKGCGKPPTPHARYCMHCGEASSFVAPRMFDPRTKPGRGR
jgi:hypothetical protein